jgi:uncharacterized protein
LHQDYEGGFIVIPVNTVNCILKITHYCNFSCKYCYYEHEMQSKSSHMDLGIAKKLIKNIADDTFYKNVCFHLHGGEPLILGLDYLRELVNLQKEFLTEKSYTNNIQTNGSLITEEIISFIKENGIHIAISIDGPKHINDKNRVFKNGQGTYEKIVKNIKLLSDHGVKFSIAAVYKEFVKDVSEMYSFLKSFDCLQKVDFLASKVYVAGSQNYGHFLSDIFDIWFNDSECEFDIRILSIITQNLLGLGNNLCMFKEVCVTQVHGISIDPYGNAYPCDNINYNYCLLGNIENESITNLLVNNPIRNRLKKMQLKRIESHRFCKWYPYCFGGCPTHFNEITKTNAYCADYQIIFSHIQHALIVHSILDEKGCIKNNNLDNIPNGILKENIKNGIRNKRQEKSRSRISDTVNI